MKKTESKLKQSIRAVEKAIARNDKILLLILKKLKKIREENRKFFEDFDRKISLKDK